MRKLWKNVSKRYLRVHVNNKLYNDFLLIIFIQLIKIYLVEANREKYQNFIKDEISKQSSFILSQINESFNTLVDRIPQDKYIQINSLNQLFSNEITKETSEHRYSFEHVYDPSQVRC